MSISMKRSSKFYVNLFIWPQIFILIIATSVFILPPNCVERTTMGVLLLLSLIIMTLMLESYLPKNSGSISTIGKLIAFSIFMVTWSTVLSTLIIAINCESFVTRSISPFIRKVIYYNNNFLDM
jgi:nicotinic acetylcholine receptor, invertebrate